MKLALIMEIEDWKAIRLSYFIVSRYMKFNLILRHV
jgi:hypothetical protein